MNKAEQIIRLKALMERNKGPGINTRRLAKYQILELELWFDCWKYPCKQGNIREPYYRWCVGEMSKGNRINWEHMKRKIQEENADIIFVR